MEQLEKLTAEQKKIYESLMVYDSVMKGWLDAEEENRWKEDALSLCLPALTMTGKFTPSLVIEPTS